ncbi:unnamed protein product [Cutaneotrichosporon oleaginosum]
MPLRSAPTLPELRAHVFRLNQQICKNEEKMDDLERSTACPMAREYTREAIAHANSVNRLLITELQAAMWQITESWRTHSSSSDSGSSDSGSDCDDTRPKVSKHVRWADTDESQL